MINKTKNLLVIGIIILIGNVTLLYGKIELESLRTSTSKTYLLENGSFQTEIFLYEINYLDEQGMYRTLEDTSVISVYTGSPNEYTYSGSVSYDDGFGMRVGRSDVTKNGSLYQTVTNPIYSDVKYYREKGMHKESLAAYQEVVELKPLDAAAYTGMGITYWKMNETQLAKAAWQRSLELNPDSNEARGWLMIAQQG